MHILIGYRQYMTSYKIDEIHRFYLQGYREMATSETDTIQSAPARPSEVLLYSNGTEVQFMLVCASLVNCTTLALEFH